MGTRREIRIEIPSGLPAQIGHEEATVLDVSTHGAQVLTPLRVHPGHKVHLELKGPVPVRCEVSIVWASFEQTSTLGTAYRSGLECLTGELSGFSDLCASLDADVGAAARVGPRCPAASARTP